MSQLNISVHDPVDFARGVRVTIFTCDAEYKPVSVFNSANDLIVMPWWSIIESPTSVISVDLTPTNELSIENVYYGVVFQDWSQTILSRFLIVKGDSEEDLRDIIEVSPSDLPFPADPAGTAEELVGLERERAMGVESELVQTIADLVDVYQAKNINLDAISDLPDMTEFGVNLLGTTDPLDLASAAGLDQAVSSPTISWIEEVTQAEYNALVPDPGTMYVVIG